MVIRYLKIAFAFCVGLLALIYAAHNLANLDAAFGAIAYVLSQADHTVYPNSLAPAVTSPALIWLVLGVICAGELAAGVLSLFGAYKLWAARRLPGAAFDEAKSFAVAGAGVAVLVWFGLFAVFGGALYQMWQTEIGSGSLEGAFQFAGLSAFALIYISLRDADVRAAA